MRTILTLFLLLVCLSSHGQFMLLVDTNGALTGTRSTNFFRTNWPKVQAMLALGGNTLSGTNGIGAGALRFVDSAVVLGETYGANGILWNFLDANQDTNTVARLLDVTNIANVSAQAEMNEFLAAPEITGLLAADSQLYGTNIWHGDLSVTSHTYTSLVNGDNSNVEIGTNYMAQLSGGTTTVNLHSFGLKREGIIVDVYLTGATNYVIYNESGTEGTATRRIVTGTGGNLTLTNAPSFLRVYRGPTRWYVMSRSN
jgi:hypothetical protein